MKEHPPNRKAVGIISNSYMDNGGSHPRCHVQEHHGPQVG